MRPTPSENIKLAHSSSIRPRLPLLRTLLTQNFALSERQYAPNSHSAVHAHAKSYIIITLDGKYQSAFDSRTEEFNPWTVTFHHSGLSHTSWYGAQGAKVLYVELPPEQLKTVAPHTASHQLHFSVQGGLIEWAARQLYREFSATDHLSQVVIDGLVMQLLGYLFRRRNSYPARLPAWLGKADEIIRNRFTEPLALSEIADAVRVHPGHLARVYVHHYRCTIGEQIRRLRVEFACDQLSSTKHRLADIALGAGFSDQSHFTVSFKQQMGTTPSQYRKALKATVQS
jgi:AraC family transcriptional regulator